MADNLIYNTQSFQVRTFATDGTSNVNSSWVDTQGADGVLFLSEFGTAATQNFTRLDYATATGASASNLATTIVRNETDHRYDVYRPDERYVRLHQERGSSSTLESAWAITYNLRRASSTATQAGSFHNRPTT